jgi:ACT domain-containing protein
MKKCVITVVGKDTVGIIARVCTYLADTKVNILDISQTIVSGYFNMMMIVDMSGSTKNFDNVNEDLNKLGENERFSNINILSALRKFLGSSAYSTSAEDACTQPPESSCVYSPVSQS